MGQIALSQLTLRNAESSDLAKIIQLVETHDDDDAEAVQESLTEINFANHFVALLDNTVIGITGYSQQLDCDHTFYLSWTYLHEDHCGKGFGKQMMDYVLDKLKAVNARKVFVKISDYVDPQDGPIYAAAMALYKKYGFVDELKLENYYDEHESMFILSLTLQENQSADSFKEENPALKFTGMFPISETESSFSFSWEASSWWKGNFSMADINVGLEAAYNEEAHQVVLSFPSTYLKIQKILQNAGFIIVGSLKDYYENGIDEVHYLYRFER